jgi:hypothetical protein
MAAIADVTAAIDKALSVNPSATRISDGKKKSEEVDP